MKNTDGLNSAGRWFAHGIAWLARTLWTAICVLVLVALSPIVEKNPVKILSHRAPIVFSMSRCIVALFSWGMYQQIAKAGIAGWPEATLCIALAYAIPILNALEKVKPEVVLEFGRALIARFGIGEVRHVGNVYRGDPETATDREHEVVANG